MTNVSVIIPILNEAKTIEFLLRYLLEKSQHKDSLEIIVVDGGSTDESQNIVSSFNEVILLHSEKGRAKQMNFGAKNATSPILYFLHSDSFPPQDFDEYIRQEVAKNNRAGCFRMQFDHGHWWLRLVSWLTRFSWRVCRGGDQSQFITKSLFDEIGGYDESYIIYEDNDLISKLYARKEFVVIQQKIITSARCYQRNGIWRLQYHFLAIHLKKRLGASPEKLHQYYQTNVI